MKNLVLSISTLLLAAMLLTSCETPGQGAKYGAIIGGGIGALATGELRGALKGAAIGAGSGALLGYANQEDRRRGRYDDRYDDDYRDQRRYRDYDDRPRERYPVARPTRYRGYVRSPYAPNNLIDVRGIPSGARVLDPSNERVFVNP